MDIIKFEEVNCKNCYNCVRHCEVKSIAVKNEQATILQDGCILCGQCFAVCAQNAKYIKSDIEQIDQFLCKNHKVYISIAPSHAAVFPGISIGQLNTAVKMLGFTSLEETAIGAGWVSAEYAKLAQQGQMRNIITTACPTIVMLIKKYYPQLIDCLAPVVSPMVAHGKLMRQIYGDRIKIVFVGPCISKKAEAEQSGIINATLSFNELKDMFDKRGINPAILSETGFETSQPINRLYPVSGGILHTVNWSKDNIYQRLAVDGLKRSIKLLDELSDQKISGYFIEMSACDGACLGGPLQKEQTINFLTGQKQVKHNAEAKTQLPAPLSQDIKADLMMEFNTNPLKQEIPDEKTIQNILAESGKADSKRQFNCGTCGYPTCRDKAIAVYQGKADVNMCLPFMREKAESFSNFVMDNMMTGIFVLNEDFIILDYNKAAIKMFELINCDYHNKPLNSILETTDLLQAKQADNNRYERTVHFKQLNKTMKETAVYIAEQKSYLLIVEDISIELNKQENVKRMREETLITAQKIIDQQMRTAQEIASLLGETTGKSKAVLTNLKNSITADMEAEIKEE